MSVETSDPFALVEVPTAAQYADAFKAMRDAGLFRTTTAQKGIQLDILKVHYGAPEHTLTSEELADGLGLQTARDATLKYGRFCKQVAEKLGISPPVSKASLAGKKPIWLAVLVQFSGGTPGVRPDDDADVRWTLLPQVVTALESTFFSHLVQ